MPDLFTGNYNFTLPEPGGSIDTWGNKLNNNWDSLDLILASLNERLEYAEQAAPIGMMAFLAMSNVSMSQIMNAPTSALDMVVKPGWVACTGRGLVASGSSYWGTHFANLIAELERQGAPFGRDSSRSPKLPDPRGMVIRAADLGAGRDPDGNRKYGTTQEDEFLKHQHDAESQSAGVHSHTGRTQENGRHRHDGETRGDGEHQHTIRTNGANSGSNGDRVSRYNTNGDTATGAKTDSAGRHSHTFQTDYDGTHTHSFETDDGGAHTHRINVYSKGGDETRMKNIVFVLCMRF